MKNFFKSTKFQAFAWTTFNGLVALVISYILDIDYMYAPLIIWSLNLITKELNREFNPNFSK